MLQRYDPLKDEMVELTQEYFDRIQRQFAAMLLHYSTNDNKNYISFCEEYSYNILCDDFAKGITYKSFDDYFDISFKLRSFVVYPDGMQDTEKEQFKLNIKNNALEAYNKFKKDCPNV